MARELIEQFWNDLIEDIKKNRLSLPMLPEVAMKARKVLDSQSVTSTKLSKVISADAVITTRLLRVVNSALYRTPNKIENVKMAVTRLGNSVVRSLVTSLAMEQLYQNHLAPEIKKLLHDKWQHNLHVAALSNVIARKFTSLNPEEALLGGLVHDIGALPILEYSERVPDLLSNPKLLNKLVMVLHPKVGHLILRTWQFPEELVKVAAEHEKLDRDTGLEPDYTDVVLVANLLSHIGSDHAHTQKNWSEITAFDRLAISPEECIEAIKDAKEEITEIQDLFTV